MADWLEPFEASYRFVRVSRLAGYEVGEVDGIRSGTLEVNRDTATYESAQVDAVTSIDVGSDLLRCYLDASWEDGSTESVCLGTWLCSVPGRSIDGEQEACTAYLDGRLQELQDDSFEAPIVVPAGTNIVAYAKQVATDAGMAVNATPSSSTLGASWSFGLESDNDEDGGSKLDAVNALLRLAGYSSASTDERGAIVMQPYRDPAGRAPVWTFEEGVNATFLAQASEELDSRDVANVVLAIFETDGATIIGKAVDSSPDSPYSTVSIGRRKVAKYSYNSTATQAQANAKALELLETNQTVIHRVTLQHVHCPARVGDVVAVEWPSAGISGTFLVRTQSIAIGSAGCMTTSELRSFVRR